MAEMINTQDQFAYNDSESTQDADGNLIDQLQGSYDTNSQNQQTAEKVTTLTKISTMEQLKIKLLKVML